MDIIFDFIFHIDQHLLDIVNEYHSWTYIILFVIIFCETGLVVTPFLPGDSMLFVIGAISAMPGMPIEINVLVLLMAIAAVLGDTCNYGIGKFFGERLFRNPNSRIFKRKHLKQAQEFYEKYGNQTIVIARFVPIVRTFAPFVAGMGKMHYLKFMIFNVAGGIGWVAIFCYGGYFCGNIPWVQANMKLLMIIIVIASLLPAIIEILRNRCKSKK